MVQPECAREVAAAIAFAREHDLALSVKGGGHGVAGRAICDDGLVIDLSRMSAVHVDPAAGTATVQGGATLRALDSGSQAHGLATTAGIYRETGVAGLALGGGVGLLMRRYGLTCDNLLAAEVVTADGRVLEASENENPDLFWALRGGGGNFGVVTRMDFRLHPLTHVFGGRLTYDFADALALGRFYRDVMADAPDDLQAYLTYSTGDGEKTASVMLCHCGPREAGEAVLDRFRRFRRPVVEHVGWITYLQMQQHWDDAFPAGKLHFWKSSFLATISDEAIRICHEAIACQSMPGCDVDLEPMGGAISRVAPDATAFADRDAASTLLITTGGTDPRETEARDRVGARDLERSPALRQGLGLRQLPGPGRRAPHGSGLRTQLPAAGRGQAHVRPREHLPTQRQHSPLTAISILVWSISTKPPARSPGDLRQP